MDSQVYLALYTLVTCLGAGLLGFQGASAARYRSERLNKASAVIAGALALAGIALFALRLGRPERLFGGFANLTSGVTIALYATVIFVVACVVVLVLSSRAEDGSVPAWAGVLAVVASLLLVAGMTCGYLLSAKLGGRLLTLLALYLGGALVLGASAYLVLAGVRADEPAMRLGRGALLACAVLAGAGLACYLAWFSMDTQAAREATKSALSMSGFTVGGGVQAAAAGEKVAGLLTGAHAALFWGGAVVCGVVVPAACGALALVRGMRAGASAGDEGAQGARVPARGVLLACGACALVFALAGGYALRACLAVLA